MSVTPTTVSVDLRQPSDTGVDLPAKGYLECSPSLRRNVDTYVVLPESFTAKLVDGKVTLLLAPTDGTVWYWKITERNNRGHTRRVSVPTPGPVNYGDLPDVFPLPPGDVIGASRASLLAEVQDRIDGDNTNADALASHLADGTDAHDASAISFAPGGTVAATNVQDAILELAGDEGGFVPTARTVNGHPLSANVTVSPDDLDDASTTHKFVTAAEKTKLGNTTGTNSGDQDLSTLVPKTRTVNGHALTADVTVSASDITTGTLPTSVLPPLAITSVTVVASQAAMLALDVQQGDVAIRSDFTPNKAFMLSSNSPGTLADWKDITATDLVQSVAGLNGNITAAGLATAIDAALGTNVANNATALGAAVAAKIRAVGDPVYAPIAEVARATAAELTKLDNATSRSRKAREIAPRFDLAADGLSTLLGQSGLTTVGGYVAASVAGTDGTAIFPVWGDKDVRASFRVRCTKAIASSKSYVGFTVSTPGTLPTSGNFTFGFGYLQGTGLVYIRENVGAATVIVADASITDGDEYDISLNVDTTLATAGGATTGIIQGRVEKAGAEITPTAGGNFTLASFPVNNMMVRTNVAGGAITNLAMTTHPTAPLKLGAPLTVGAYVYAAASENVFLRVPSVPNGKLVLALHGHGGNATETGQTSSTYKPTWDALTAAGFTVAVPTLGGDLWGNNAAQTLLASIYALLTARYDLDPEAYLWGNSMGGGASLTAIAKQTIPVRAAYLAEPACDLAALSATFPTIGTAYASTALRDANDPMKFAASAFAGVPMLFTASASDTTVSKTANTDAMRTKLGATVPNYLVTATGVHTDPSHFRAQDTLNFFRANL